MNDRLLQRRSSSFVLQHINLCVIDWLWIKLKFITFITHNSSSLYQFQDLWRLTKQCSIIWLQLPVCGPAIIWLFLGKSLHRGWNPAGSALPSPIFRKDHRGWMGLDCDQTRSLTQSRSFNHVEISNFDPLHHSRVHLL